MTTQTTTRLDKIAHTVTAERPVVFTRTQNQLFNRLMSESQSDCVPDSGTDVAMFLPRADMTQALKSLGFTQEIKRCNFQGDTFGHSMWWHEQAKVLVLYASKASSKWTFANETDVMMLSDLAVPA